MHRSWGTARVVQRWLGWTIAQPSLPIRAGRPIGAPAERGDDSRAWACDHALRGGDGGASAAAGPRARIAEGGLSVKAQAAGRRPATMAKQPRTATPPWRKRRRGSARQTPTQPPVEGISSAAALTAPASPMAMVAAAAARIETRLSAAVGRIQAAAVPVEPVPTAWTPVEGISSAAALTAPASAASMVAAAAARIGKRLAALPVAVQRLQASAVPVEPVPTAWAPVGAPLAPGASTPASPAAAAQLFGGRLAALSAAAGRIQAAAVPVEPVPTAWTRVGVIGPMTSVESAASAAPVVAAETAPAPVTIASAASVTAIAVVAVAAGVGIAAPAHPGASARPAPARSIKGGPPKAPRPRKSAELQTGPVSLPDVVVPVMATEAIVADAPHADTPAGLETAHLTFAVPMDASNLTTALVPMVAAIPFAASPSKPQVIDRGQDPGVERARSTSAQRIGDDAERLAAIRLEALGWRIIARNLRVSRAEIDLLAIDPADPPMLVIVEVRRRNRRDFGLAEETVDFRKRAMLRRAAGELAMRATLPDGRRLPPLPVRVDLIAIDRGPDGRPSMRHHRGIET